MMLGEVLRSQKIVGFILTRILVIHSMQHHFQEKHILTLIVSVCILWSDSPLPSQCSFQQKIQQSMIGWAKTPEQKPLMSHLLIMGYQSMISPPSKSPGGGGRPLRHRIQNQSRMKRLHPSHSCPGISSIFPHTAVPKSPTRIRPKASGISQETRWGQGSDFLFQLIVFWFL